MNYYNYFKIGNFTQGRYEPAYTLLNRITHLVSSNPQTIIIVSHTAN